MGRKITATILCFVVLALAFGPVFFNGDYLNSALQKFAPAHEKSFCEKMVTLLETRNFDEFKKNVDPKLALSEALFKKLAEQLPPEVVIHTHVIGAYTNVINGVTHYSLTFEYEYPDKWMEIMFALRVQGDATLIEGLQIVPLTDSIENLTRFSLKRMIMVQQLVLLLSICILLFDMYVLVSCIHTPIPRYKWLWVLFIMAGVDTFLGFNWLSGFFIDWHHIGIMIPVVTFSKGLYWPLVITIRLPLGAIIFMLKRKKYLSQQTSSAPVA